jgi:hypothetical protein
MSDLIAKGRGEQKREKAAKNRNFFVAFCPFAFLSPLIAFPLIFVMDRGELDDLEETRATGRLYFNLITFFFVEQALADRR